MAEDNVVLSDPELSPDRSSCSRIKGKASDIERIRHNLHGAEALCNRGRIDCL